MAKENNEGPGTQGASITGTSITGTCITRKRNIGTRMIRAQA